MEMVDDTGQVIAEGGGGRGREGLPQWMAQLMDCSGLEKKVVHERTFKIILQTLPLRLRRRR